MPTINLLNLTGFSLVLFWFIRTAKNSLLFLYLWQLKEYHIPRFLDHFRTKKGKALFLNPLFFSKISLLFLFVFALLNFSAIYKILLFFPPFILLSAYLVENARFLQNIIKKRVLGPVATQKIIVLLFVVFSFQAAITLHFAVSITEQNFFQKELILFSLRLLFFDIFWPIIVSFFVLLFQPFVIFAKNRVIGKAEEKIKNLPELLTVGITGSYGKTSTKDFLYDILAEKFSVSKTKEHQNSEMGVAESILKEVKNESEVFVCEMGAYKKGSIKLLCDIVKPKIGILTGINEQHQALFGSLENIINTKYELIQSLPKDGVAIFNGENPHCFELYLKTEKEKRIVCADRKSAFQCDLLAENVKVLKNKIEFDVVSKENQRVYFEIYLLGRQNVENILLATQAAREMGMNLKEIVDACKKIKPKKGTMQKEEGRRGITIIDDSYNANPAGVMAALDYLSVWEKKKIIVMPCLIELGKNRDKIHFQIGEKIGKICDLAIICAKECFENIKSGAKKSEMAEENIFFSENSKEIVKKIEKMSERGSVVLLEGRIPKEVKNLIFSFVKENEKIQ